MKKLPVAGLKIVTMATEEEVYNAAHPAKAQTVCPTPALRTEGEGTTTTIYSMFWNRNFATPSKKKTTSTPTHAVPVERQEEKAPVPASPFLKYCQIHVRDSSVLYDRHGAKKPLNRVSSSGIHLLSPNGSRPGDAVGSTLAGAAHGLLDRWKPTSPTPLSSLSSRDEATELRSYCHHHPLGRHAQTLQFTQGDIMKVAMDDRTFQSLKDGLRKRGVITNNYLRENLHFYVQHIKQVEAARRQTNISSHSPLRKNASESNAFVQ